MIIFAGRIHLLKHREHGFTLLEVAASFLIISFILIGLLSLMQSSKKLSSENIDQLVMTSFATGSLKRILDRPALYFPKDQDIFILKKNAENQMSISGLKKLNTTYSFTPNEISTEELKPQYHLFANNQNYFLKIDLSQTTVDQTKQLINVVISVSKDQTFKKEGFSVEGYLSYAENEEKNK